MFDRAVKYVFKFLGGRYLNFGTLRPCLRDGVRSGQPRHVCVSIVCQQDDHLCQDFIIAFTKRSKVTTHSHAEDVKPAT